MKITGVETFAVNTGFRPARPWLFCAVRTDEGTFCAVAQGAVPELIAGTEHDTRTIGRKNRGRSCVALELEGSVHRRNQRSISGGDRRQVSRTQKEESECGNN